MNKEDIGEVTGGSSKTIEDVLIDNLRMQH